VLIGGLMVIVIASDLRFVGSNPSKDDGFLRAIKIHITLSTGREANPSASFVGF
jgi:hypothetical protein